MATEPLERQRYGEYEIESRLGRGSVGTVYLARHRRLGRRVALKVMQYEQDFEDAQDRAEFEARLQREAELCAALQHPNLVTLYEAGYNGDVIEYLATEFVDGETLLARLKRTRPIPLPEALSIAADILRGLDYAHSKRIVHRDIKPANIFLTAAGQAKIGDFGVARPDHSTLTVAGSLIGTPNYMSPEQVKTTRVTTRSDLFSAGVVLYEILTGVRPFAAPELSGILFNVVTLDPVPANRVNPAVPDGVGAVVAKLMAKHPEDRYASAGEALEELERIRALLPRPAPGTRTSSFDETTPLPTERSITARAEEEPELLTTGDLVGEPTIRRRLRVPAALFWGITIALLASLLAVVQSIRVRIDDAPSVRITDAELQRFAEKDRALALARSLVHAGRFEDAVRSYDAFLGRYPTSVVAREERGRAAGMLEEMKAAAEEEAKKKVTVSARRPPVRRAKAASPEPEPPAPPPSRWERVKRWFRGTEKKEQE